MAAHFENEHRHGESGPDPESPRHVRQFVVFAHLRRRLDRLQRHSAYGAIAWSYLAYLRVHRAGVDDADDGWGRGRAWRCAVGAKVSHGEQSNGVGTHSFKGLVRTRS